MQMEGIVKFTFLTPRFIIQPKTAKNGRDDVQSFCNALKIELERCIATQWGPDWAAIWGKPI